MLWHRDLTLEGDSLAKKEKYVIKKLLQFEPWMSEAIQDIRFEKRMNTEAEAWRHVIEAGLDKLGKGKSKNED